MLIGMKKIGIGVLEQNLAGKDFFFYFSCELVFSNRKSSVKFLSSANSSLVDYLPQVENRKNEPTLSGGGLGNVWVY